MPEASVPHPLAPDTAAASTASPASDSAFALLEAFSALGVRDVVVCPGSRSQALALAAAALAQENAVRLHVRLDERGAAFLALGLAVETGTPSLVVTTSGTAVANLHPAVLEAHHSGVPLIVLTADRPEELRGIRANQTTVQPGIFGPAVRLLVDAPAPVADAGETDAAAQLAARAVAAATDAANPGPVHLNLQYREPLSSAGARRSSPAATTGSEPGAQTAPDQQPVPSTRPADSVLIEHGPLTVVVAGADAGEQAESFARAGGWPLVAEVSSGAHFGPNLVVAYREVLADAELGGRVERVIVFGHPTLSREVPALIQRAGVETVVVGGGAEHYDPGHAVDAFAREVHVEQHQPSAEERRWTGRWVAASRRILDAGDSADAAPLSSGVALGGHVEDFAAQREYVRAEFAAVRAPVTRRMLAQAVWNATWPHDRLVFGASRLIRDADRAVAGRRIRVHSNRGLAGIDGTVATALGIALASQAGGGPGTTRALIGDLTLLHDVGSLLIGTGEHRPRLLLVVGNDGGGTIFDTLEVAGTAPSSDFDRVLYTPQSVDVAALAAAYGWEYRTADTHGRLAEAMTLPVTGPTILEVPLPR